jgi:hypothetical protein
MCTTRTCDRTPLPQQIPFEAAARASPASADSDRSACTPSLRRKSLEFVLIRREMICDTPNWKCDGPATTSIEMNPDHGHKINVFQKLAD